MRPVPDARALALAAARVPSLPRIYGRLAEALDNPRASSGHIAEIIGGDAGLSARLLRLVNSAFYCFPARVESISHAVTLVGTEQIRELALATSILRVFSGIPADLVDMESFWLHGVSTGVAARALAVERREPSAERLFVGGVLHDVGRLFMYRAWPDTARCALNRAKQTSAPLMEVERAEFGFDHATAGGLVLEAWRLSPALVEMTRHHHEPLAAVDHALDVAAVHVADVIATALELGHSGDRAVPRLCREAWDRLELPASAVTTIAPRVEQQVDEVRRSLLGAA